MLAWRLCLYSDGPVLISQVGLEAAQEVLVREILKELPCALVASGARSIALAFPPEAVRPHGCRPREGDGTLDVLSPFSHGMRTNTEYACSYVLEWNLTPPRPFGYSSMQQRRKGEAEIPGA